MASINNKSVANLARTVAPKAVVAPRTFTGLSHNIRNNNGAMAYDITPIEQLRRTVLSCMLWEDSAYESGEQIANRIERLIGECDPSDVAHLAREARHIMKLRHVPLFMCITMLKYPEHKKYVRKTLASVIERPDELGQALALYWKDALSPARTTEDTEIGPRVTYVSQRKSDLNLPLQLRRGLEDALQKFDSYQLKKYLMKDKPVSMADILRIVHPKGKTDEIKATYGEIVKGTATAPDTWESRLSSSGRSEKATIFTDMLERNKLGAMALLKNLRGMTEAGVDTNLINTAIQKMNTERVLPFRFLTAARHAPQFKSSLGEAMLKSLKDIQNLPGHTVLLIDISGSMGGRISGKSDLRRIDAAAAIAIMLKEICQSSDMFVFNYGTYQVRNDNVFCVNQPTANNHGYSRIVESTRIYNYEEDAVVKRGFDLSDLIVNSVVGGTDLQQAVSYINNTVEYDRMIIFTDDESSTVPPAPRDLSYSINVSTGNYGVTYGDYVHINGFSEGVIGYVTEYDKYVKSQN
ncbi:TROVE domain-containing protein [Rhizobium phage RHph_TM30]|uniref:TROVE domain-containing protein n=1 Tax=Rhizobium phage RHph_TM30 TaxID=2509764 RepID=A0A7S5R5A7_9CAUD|nr:TROVE domain-containing protein [Rhizobium phage RHph_TM30]QIG71398.1 TROVE domain-containing protein [Rhizobium phage RHph_TM30]